MSAHRRVLTPLPGLDASYNATHGSRRGLSSSAPAGAKRALAGAKSERALAGAKNASVRGNVTKQRAAGSVLIVVLWVCLGLVSMTLLFGHAMLLNYRGADNDVAGRQADDAIEGAARYAQIVTSTTSVVGMFPDVTTYQSEAVPVGDATFWFIGRPASGATNDFGTTRAYGLIDEASKLNLNTATVAMLQQLPGMTQELAASIIDWRDTDDNVTQYGAESSTYQARKPSYACKNAPFESVEELLLVNAADKTIVYGEDTNLNGVLDGTEDSDRTVAANNGDGKLDPGIFEYVTAFTREPNKRNDGTARVNILQLNGQKRADLQTMLSASLGSTRAQQIMQALGPTNNFSSPLAFYMRSQMSPTEYDQIADGLTVVDGDYIPGLVNANTASQTVLACIPGIGPDLAATLVGTRATRAQQTDMTDITWVTPVLGQAGIAQAGKWLTGRSFQVSADVAAVGHNGRGYRRTRFVIDNSTTVPRIIYRRNLASLGWALGSEVRQSLANPDNKGAR